jgi:hypothetical protein
MWVLGNAARRVDEHSLGPMSCCFDPGRSSGFERMDGSTRLGRESLKEMLQSLLFAQHDIHLLAMRTTGQAICAKERFAFQASSTSRPRDAGDVHAQQTRIWWLNRNGALPSHPKRSIVWPGGDERMTAKRIALRCPHCLEFSYRSDRFVQAKISFVCNHCRELVLIDKAEVSGTLVRLETTVEG